EAYDDPTKYFSLLTRPHAPITAGTTILAQSPASEEKYLRAAMTDDLDDPFWKDGGRSDEELIDEWKDIPTCFVSGWYANHLTANFDKFRALSARFESPVELVVG